MRVFSLILFFGCCIKICQAQQLSQVELPSEKDVTRVETFLASDDLKGRKTFSPEIEKASDFIENEFRTAGLKPFFGKSYRQEFFMYSSVLHAGSLKIDGKAVEPASYLALGSREHLQLSLNSFHVFEIKKEDAPQKRWNMLMKIIRDRHSGSNALILIDPSLPSFLEELKNYKFMEIDPDRNTVLMLLSGHQPAQLEYTAENKLIRQPLNNVAAVLPGTDRASEYVIFSAHYDHLGTGKNASAQRQPEAGKDSVFNGANDDASGTTAVIELAHYFARKHDNRRSLLFVTFTAEEIGEYGSQYFSASVNPEKVVAMFNIEMIGTQSKWTTNSAYITGYERSDFGKILQANLKGSVFHFYPDPYPAQNLFYRSDNAQLALKGVPSHTISTSKMDDEHNYHTPQDEIGTLDLSNMARIIDAIALSSKGIIAGAETPTRVSIEKN